MKTPDIATAIRIYYTKTEIGNKEIRELFSSGSANTVELMDIARKVIEENKVITFIKTNVETKSAYQAWGLDIKSYEARYAKIKSLDLLAASDSN